MKKSGLEYLFRDFSKKLDQIIDNFRPIRPDEKINGYALLGAIEGFSDSMKANIMNQNNEIQRANDCYFCGEITVIEENENYFWVACLSCGGEGPAKPTKKEAVETWNLVGQHG